MSAGKRARSTGRRSSSAVPLRPDGPRDDVPGRQLVREPGAAAVEQKGSLAAERLAEEEPAPREHGRMELDELEVGERRARAPGEQRAVADRAGRVRRPLPQSSHAAGCEERGRGADSAALGDRSHAAAVVLAEREHARVLDKPHVGIARAARSHSARATCSPVCAPPA